MLIISPYYANNKLLIKIINQSFITITITIYMFYERLKSAIKNYSLFFEYF